MSFEAKPMKVANLLQKQGFFRSVAGTNDFNTAVNAIVAMCAEDKGLIVSGTFGCGKTWLVTALLNYVRPFFSVHLGDSEEVNRLTPEVIDFWHFTPYVKNVFLDDLGAERIKNDYGTRANLVGDFILSWHDRHTPGLRMFITTNLNENQVDDIYGGRVLSRLKDLCVPCHLTGADKRKWTIPNQENNKQ